MKFAPPLQEAVLVRRHQRFLAQVRLADGSEQTAHCPNTGRMTGCAEPGSRVWLRRADGGGRKYPLGWELVECAGRKLACIHSARANQVVEEALQASRITELTGYGDYVREVDFPDGGGRADFFLGRADTGWSAAGGYDGRLGKRVRKVAEQRRSHRPAGADEAGPADLCWMEVKSVTLALPGGLGVFPDAPSARGRRHLEELIRARRAGHRALLMFCLMHQGILKVAPADTIDPDYGRLLRQALEVGVEVLAYRTRISPREVTLTRSAPVLPRQP